MLFVHKRVKMYHGLHKNIKEILKYWTVFSIDNNNNKYYNFLTANQHIRMISERSCDTEDWSNDAENTALILLEGITKYRILKRKQLF